MRICKFKRILKNNTRMEDLIDYASLAIFFGALLFVVLFIHFN